MASVAMASAVMTCFLLAALFSGTSALRNQGDGAPSGGRRFQRVDPGSMWFGPAGGDDRDNLATPPNVKLTINLTNPPSESNVSDSNGTVTTTAAPEEDDDTIVFYDDEDVVTSVETKTSTSPPKTTTTTTTTTTEKPTTTTTTQATVTKEAEIDTTPSTTEVSRHESRSLWSGAGPRRRTGPSGVQTTSTTVATTVAAPPKTKTGEVNYWDNDGPADPSAANAASAASDEQHREVQVSVKEHDRNPHPFAFSSGGDSQWFGFGGGGGGGGGGEGGGGGDWGFSKSRGPGSSGGSGGFGGGFGGSGPPAVVEVADYQSKSVDDMGTKEVEQEPKVEIKEHDELGPVGPVSASDGAQWFGGGGGGGGSSGSRAPSSGGWGGMGGGGGGDSGGDPADNVWFGVEAASDWNPVASSSHIRRERKLSWGADGKTPAPPTKSPDYEELDIITAPPKSAAGNGPDVFSFVVDASFGGNSNRNLKKASDRGSADSVDIITAAPPAGKESRSSDFTWFGVDGDPGEARVRDERGPPEGASVIVDEPPPPPPPLRALRPSADFRRPIDERRQFFVESPPQPPPPPQFVPIVGRNRVPWGLGPGSEEIPPPNRRPFFNPRPAPRVEFPNGGDARFGNPEVGPQVVVVAPRIDAGEVQGIPEVRHRPPPGPIRPEMRPRPPPPPQPPIEVSRNDDRDRVRVVEASPTVDSDDYFLEETDETQPEIVANSASDHVFSTTASISTSTARPPPTAATVSKMAAVSSSSSSVVTSKSVVTATSPMVTPPSTTTTTTSTIKPRPSRPAIITSRTSASPITTTVTTTTTTTTTTSTSRPPVTSTTTTPPTPSTPKSTPPTRYFYKDEGIDQNNVSRKTGDNDEEEIELSLVELTPSVVVELDSNATSVRAGRKFGRLPPTTNGAAASDMPSVVVDDRVRINDLNPRDPGHVHLDANTTDTNFSLAAATRDTSDTFPHLLSADTSGGSPSSPTSGLSTENLAYVLVGACCALSLISLLIVVSIVRYRRLQRRQRLAQQKGFHGKHSPVYSPTSYPHYPRPQRESRLANLNPVTWLDRSYGGETGRPQLPAGAVVPAVDLAPSNRGRFWFMGRNKQSPYSLCDQHLSYCGNPGYNHDAPITGDYMNLTQGVETQPLAAPAPVGSHPAGGKGATYRSGFNSGADLRHASGLESMNKGEMIYWSSNNEQLI